MSKRKVLVVISSATTLDLKHKRSYSTGYYLNEFVIPRCKRAAAGYEPAIADPNGDRPVMDASSNDAMFFGGDEAACADALAFAEGLALLPRSVRPARRATGPGSGVMKAPAVAHVSTRHGG